MGLSKTALDGQLHQFIIRHVAVKAEVIVGQRGTGGTHNRPAGSRHNGLRSPGKRLINRKDKSMIIAT